MSRLFTSLCLALFTVAAPACDDQDPKDPAPTDEENSTGSESSDSSGNPDDLAPGGEEDGTSSETGDSPGTATLAPGGDSGEDPGTATLATPHISTGETL